MDHLSNEQVQEGFRLLGLATEKERAEFTRYAQTPLFEDQHEFIRLDFASQKPEAAPHVKLA